MGKKVEQRNVSIQSILGFAHGESLEAQLDFVKEQITNQIVAWKADQISKVIAVRVHKRLGNDTGQFETDITKAETAIDELNTVLKELDELKSARADEQP